MKGTTAFYFGRKVVRNKPVHNFSAKKILPSRKFTKGWDSVNSKLTGDEANRYQWGGGGGKRRAIINQQINFFPSFLVSFER